MIRAVTAVRAKRTTPQPHAAAQLDALLQRFDVSIRTLVGDARASLRGRLPAAVEMVYANSNAVAIAFASSERRGDIIVSLSVYARGVNLYFLYGVALEDPHRLLQGSGNQGRFLRLESAAMLDRPEIGQLIDDAVAECDTPLPTRGRGALIIKSVSAKVQARVPRGRQETTRRSARARNGSG